MSERELQESEREIVTKFGLKIGLNLVYHYFCNQVMITLCSRSGSANVHTSSSTSILLAMSWI
jgi:hypothetical protein